MSAELDRAKTERVVITSDARPDEQYAALQILLGHQVTGWGPAWDVDSDDVEDAIADADREAREHGVTVRWSEPYIDPIEYRSGPISAIVAEPVG